MKYMYWRDLKPGDIIRFTDEYLRFLEKSDLIDKCDYECDYDLYNDLHIMCIKNCYDRIKIYFFNDSMPWVIHHDGLDYCNDIVGLKFKIIKLKERL